MNRPLVLSAGLLLALTAAFAQALAGPLPARACSCIFPLPTIARVAGEPNTVVIVGTIHQPTADRTPVAVDTWFHGPGASDVVVLNFGNQMVSSCDPSMTPGERRLMVLHRQEDGTFSYSPCVATGVIGTEEGDAALAEATELFAGEAPPTPEPTPPPQAPTPEPEPADTSWLFIGGALGAAVLVFGGVAFLSLRRKPG